MSNTFLFLIPTLYFAAPGWSHAGKPRQDEFSGPKYIQIKFAAATESNIQRAIDLGSYKVHSDSYIFEVACAIIYLLCFLAYIIFIFWFGFCRSFLHPQCIYASVCDPHSLATSEVLAWRLPPIYGTRKGAEGCGSSKKLFYLHFTAGLMSRVAGQTSAPGLMLISVTLGLSRISTLKEAFSCEVMGER